MILRTLGPKRCLTALALALAVLTVLTWFALVVAVYGFDYPAARLNPVQSGPLVLTDRHGAVLRRVPAVSGRPGQDAWTKLDQISPWAVLTLIGSEDMRFFEHRGVDGLALLRSVYLDLSSFSLAYGGSTLTMQLMRMVHHSGQPRSFCNKLSELVLALRAERALSKQELLEQYLNRACYGHGAYGFAAAARTYFDKDAAALSAGEATLLALLPRGPGVYDPLRHLDRALRRRDHVLALLVTQGRLSAAQVERIRSEQVAVRFHGREFRAAHFVDAALASLPANVREAGGTVQTTLDLVLQERLERAVKEHVAGLAGRGLDQAGVVVLDTVSGEVRAMVGSEGFDASGGQVNITTTRRHPGSALKPFVYALALEQGATPASIAYDIADAPSSYRVVKVTQAEHGPVRYREALAGSYNLAAVHVLEQVGVERLISCLRAAGVGEVQGSEKDYGPRLALGATKVRLVDLAAGYGFLGTGGLVAKPRYVRTVTSASAETWRAMAAPPARVFSKAVAWLTMSMLADPEARRTAFGYELPVDDLPFRVAFKTGTSRGFSDTVAVAVTEQLTVAAWAGNFDGRPTEGLIAMDAAAPLVRAGLLAAANGKALTLPLKPDGIVTAHVCPVSGKRAGPDCPDAMLEHFATGTVPTTACDWHTHNGGALAVRYPAEISAWASRNEHAGGRGI